MTEPKDIRVGDAMTSTVQTIEAMATVDEAIRRMGEAGISSLVVERRHDADEFGLLVVADIAREVIAKDRPPERVNVYEIMSKPVLSVPVDMKLNYAVRHLVRFELSRALVVDAQRQPLGMVTLRDMVLHYAKDQGHAGTAVS